MAYTIYNYHNNIIPIMEKTLIFVDWDDTLFPTEWVRTSNVDLNYPSIETVQMFGELDKLITDMIINMTFLGSVLIVTNGSSGWVNICLNVLPNFKQIIEGEAISVTSARDLFSHEHKTNEWKKLTFKIFFNEHFNESVVYRILSFGDSDAEHEAVQELKNYNNEGNKQKRIIGSIKFIKYPSLNDLINQLETVRLIHKDIVMISDDNIFNLADFIL